MELPQITSPDLFRLIGQATADADAWRRRAEQLEADVVRLAAELKAVRPPVDVE